jgi:hypothetical protein
VTAVGIQLSLSSQNLKKWASVGSAPALGTNFEGQFLAALNTMLLYMLSNKIILSLNSRLVGIVSNRPFAASLELVFLSPLSHASRPFYPLPLVLHPAAHMRAIIQRVTSGSVTVDGNVVSSIGKGIVVLVGVG